ncbi:hypothetical protein GCM10009630_52020 [Kribbella jejuensis]|uniref:Uncharacterized protein n=1 Tax=Kribbella jejuensis TaxID=236068 RepID=A0A542ET85_9ACTN|nr:hypothetical protein [Kribbella jejuensis]TQJ18510.1 hypothetical protein FB475_2655 [Kribbella jejuensis]
MARTVTRRAMLGAGLLTLAAVGGAGGYGAGWFLTAEPSLAGTASPLPMGSIGTTSAPSPTATPTPRKITYDNSPALHTDDLSYRTQTFTVQSVVKSRITVRVPDGWGFTQPDPPTTGRFTDPTGKRWLRIEGGFTIKRAPAVSMQARLAQLSILPANQMFHLLSQDVEQNYATIAYTSVPPTEQAREAVLRYTIVRWVANETGNCAVEMSSTGLPQDQDALMDVLEHATKSVQRRDSPLNS